DGEVVHLVEGARRLLRLPRAGMKTDDLLVRRVRGGGVLAAQTLGQRDADLRRGRAGGMRSEPLAHAREKIGSSRVGRGDPLRAVRALADDALLIRRPQ